MVVEDAEVVAEAAAMKLRAISVYLALDLSAA
jgi:hypothetical protein